jgi:TolB protein
MSLEERRRKIRAAVLTTAVFAVSGVATYALFQAFREANEAQRISRVPEALPVPEYDFAYASDKGGDFDLYLATLDGSLEVRLTEGELAENGPRWSPDGKLILYSLTDFQTDIWVMAVSEGTAQAVTSDKADEFAGTWSSDGAMLAYTTGDSTIEIITLDGNGRRRLTDGFHPAWSPDGATIAFGRAVGDETDQTDIWVMEASGGTKEALTDMPGSEQFPAWSPDGQSLAFMGSDEAGVGQIYVLNVEDRTVRRLTGGPMHKSEPAWSPDGLRILYEVRTENSTYGNTDLYVINVDGTNPQAVVSGPSQDVSPAWNPAAASSK